MSIKRIVLFFVMFVSNFLNASPYSHFIHSLNQRWLTLDSGFIWEIENDSYRNVKDWQQGDEIVLSYENSRSRTLSIAEDLLDSSQNKYHRPGKPIELIFKLTNLRTNATVQAFYHDFQELWIAPQIKSNDHNGKIIVLTDNTQWQVGWVHSFYSSGWKPSQRILIMPQADTNDRYILVNPDHGLGPHYKDCYYDSAVEAKLVSLEVIKDQ